MPFHQAVWPTPYDAQVYQGIAYAITGLLYVVGVPIFLYRAKYVRYVVSFLSFLLPAPPRRSPFVSPSSLTFSLSLVTCLT